MAPNLTANDFIAKVNELGDCRDNIRDAYQSLLDKINQVIKDMWQWQMWYYDDQLERIRELAKTAGRRLDKAIDLITHVVEGSVPVLSLYETAFDWTGDVKGPVSTMDAEIRQPKVNSLEQWTGAAASAYNNMKLLHANAVAGTGNAADAIAKWLAAVAQANVNFILELVTPATNLAKNLTALLIDLAAVATVLEAIGKAAEMIGELLADAWKIVKSTVSKMAADLGQAVDASAILNTKNAFPSGAWPDTVKQ